MRFLFPVLFCVLPLSSCDKAKEVATKAKQAVSEGISLASEAVDRPGETDPELEKLIDRNEQGYLFRSDFPFPDKLAVVSRSDVRVSGRMARVSVFGDERAALDGAGFKAEDRYEKNGGQVIVNLGEVQELQPAEKDGPEEEVWKSVKPAARLTVGWRDGKWKPLPDGQALDFSRAASYLHDDFDHKMIEQGLVPRPFWFGKGRLKVGDTLTLSGAQLKMIDGLAEEGRVDIRFEAVEPVYGHPCGVFSMKGDYAGLSDGGRVEMTIQSGKVWLSLLRPLLLKSDVEMIFTSRSGDSGKSMGTQRIRTEREWKSGE